jgi:predicted nucleic acid-binding Zn ribbon protein
MPTYIYETIPESCCADSKHYEINQCETDAPLTRHPETNEPIKRVLLGGKELIKKADGDSCCSGPACC